MTVTIVNKSFAEFQSEVNGKEGIVLLGCGGDLQEWVQGVTSSLHESNCIFSVTPSVSFSDFIVLKTNGGRTDLVMMFKKDANISIGRMAMWRLQFGDCSWVSDYIVNYADQHGFSIQEDCEEIEFEDEE